MARHVPQALEPSCSSLERRSAPQTGAICVFLLRRAAEKLAAGGFLGRRENLEI